MRCCGWIAVAALATSGCFDPRFREGATCDPAIGCPPGLDCHPTQRICVREVTDAAPPDAAPPGVCGDGRPPGRGREDQEECDDGNDVDGDGCDSDCFRTIRSIHAGGMMTCALLRSGDVRCWGSGVDGALGHGAEVNYGDNEPASASPFAALGIIATEIDAGLAHSCALGSSALRCWGRAPMIGYPNGEPAVGDDELPSSVGDVVIGEPVKHVSSGRDRTCAIATTDQGDRVWCWGMGVLGYGNTNTIGDNETPAAAGPIALGVAPVRLASGAEHTCAIVAGGEVRCWGTGLFGQLGHANQDAIGDNELPSSAGPVDVGGEVIDIAAGDLHTCAVLADQTLRCWGAGVAGRLGHGNQDNIGDGETPASAGPVPVDAGVVQVSAGFAHTCALLDGGRVRCWGNGSDGQLGYGNGASVGDNEVPTRDVSLGGPAAQVSAGAVHTCALMASGAVRCWGQASRGSLGYGDEETIGDDEVPTDVGFVPVLAL